NQIKTRRIFASRGTSADKRELARDDGLQRQFNLRLEISNECDAAAFADAVDRHFDRGRQTNHFKGGVDARSESDDSSFFKVRFIYFDRLGSAESARKLEFALVQIDGDDLSTATRAQHLHDQQPNHSRADH